MNSKIIWKHSQEDTSSIEGSDSFFEGDSARWEFASDSIRNPGAVSHSYGRCLFVSSSDNLELYHGLRLHTADNVSTSPRSKNLESSTSDESVCHSCGSSSFLTSNSNLHHKIGKSESLDHANCSDNESWYASNGSTVLLSNDIPVIHSPLIEDGLYNLNLHQSNNSSTSSESEHSFELNVDSISSEEEEQIQWWSVCLRFIRYLHTHIFIIIGSVR